LHTVDNKTLVDLQHSGFKTIWTQYMQSFEDEWKEKLNHLKMACEDPNFCNPWSKKKDISLEV